MSLGPKGMDTFVAPERVGYQWNPTRWHHLRVIRLVFDQVDGELLGVNCAELFHL